MYNSFLIRYAVFVGQCSLAGYESYYMSDSFRAGFKSLSVSQPVCSPFVGDKETIPEAEGRTAIKNISYKVHTVLY